MFTLRLNGGWLSMSASPSSLVFTSLPCWSFSFQSALSAFCPCSFLYLENPFCPYILHQLYKDIIYIQQFFFTPMILNFYRLVKPPPQSILEYLSPEKLLISCWSFTFFHFLCLPFPTYCLPTVCSYILACSGCFTTVTLL